MKNTRPTDKNKLMNVSGIGLLIVLLSLVTPSRAAAAAPGAHAGTAQAELTQSHDSLDAILKDLSGYKFDQGVGAPLRLRAYVAAHKDDPAERTNVETKLLAFLQTSPAPGGVMAACRAFRLIGSAAAVPVLEAMLLKPDTTDPARYALEKIPGGEADKALVTALGKTQGDVKRGIVFSMGERRAGTAVPALEGLANGKDAAVAGDAVKALGKIGGSEAVRVLETALVRSADPLKSDAASSLLACSEIFLRTGKNGEAAAIYDKLLGAGLGPVRRQAAFKGKISAVETGAGELILKTLAGKDAVLYAPAIAMIPKAFPASDIGRVLPLLGKLPEDAQVQLTAVLAGYPADIVLPTVLKAAESPSSTVRMEALRSIGKIGTASTVGFLVGRAATTTGDEQAAVRNTLWRLRGSDVDAAILDRLAKESDDKVKSELIQAASERRITAAKPFLMETVKAGPPPLKGKAAAALREIATYADLRDLLGLLMALDDEAAREAMQDTAAGAARTNPRPLARAEAVKAIFANEKDSKKKADLLRVLGKIGDDSALPLVRRALADPDKDVVDAAVRALADWPGVAARDDDFGIAQNSPNLTHRVLALRAYVATVGLELYRAPNAAVADLEKALALAGRPEEKKLVLGLLPQFACPQGLKVAESLLADPAVKDEAKAAADRIRASLGRK